MKEKGHYDSDIKIHRFNTPAANKAEIISRRFIAAQRIARIGFWEYDILEEEVYLSEEIFRLWNSEDQNVHLTHETVLEVIHPDDREMFLQIHGQALSEGEDFELEYRGIMPTGQPKWLRESGRVIRDETGTAIRLEGTLQDVSEHRKEQEELFLQRERQRRILDSQTTYIIRTDLQGHYTYANQKYKDDFGWVFGEESLLGKSTFTTVLDYHHERLLKLTEQVLTSPTVIRMELDKHTADGCIKTTRWDVISIADSEGVPREVQCTGIDLSDQVAAEASVKESNARYELVRKATSEIIWDTDLMTGRNYWGEGFYTHFGHALTDLKDGRFWEDHLHPEDAEAVQRTATQALEGDAETWEAEYRFRQADGTYAFVVDRAFIIRNEQGVPIRMVGAMQNISDKKRLEMLLQKATSLSRIGSFEYDAQTQQLFWSKMTREIHEVSSSYIPELSKWKEFFQPQDQAVMEQLVQQAVENGTSFDRELLLTPPGGTKKWVRVIADPVIEDGLCLQLNGSVQDIDKIKRAVLEKRSAFEEKERILESIEDGFFALNQALEVTYWNNKAIELTRYPKEEVLGKSISEVFSKQIMEQFLAGEHESIKIDKRKHFEIYQENVDAWFDVTLYPLENGSSVFFRDISERKRSEMQLHQLNESLQQYTEELVSANKDLEQFSFIVSHNLRAPVANILGLAELINDPQYPQDLRNKMFKELQGSIYRIDEVIKDLNTILRVKNERGERKEVVLLEELVESITSSIKYLNVNDEVRVETDFNQVPQFHTVRSYMHSIFYNFISNSMKYRHPERSPVIVVSTALEDGKVLLKFKDNGLGIDMEANKDLVFGLYNRFHSHVDGKGMGLFMVKSQVEMLGGKITVDSQVGEGTEFCVTFENDILEGLT